MHWPNSLLPEAFLATYWQKLPLFLPAAIDVELPQLDANELAWLATLPDVESKLVFTDRSGNKRRYRVEHGPFSDSELNTLPAEDWTLLIQDVDKHLPDFRTYFDQVPFIPSWRIDDLMVSLAAPGGSVGPHKDNYDVFLCQGTGERSWSISDNKLVPADLSTTALDLLQPFEASTERLCKSGDVLYVPPGTPHWGVAKNICTTYSIGMRAPTREELLAGFFRIYEPESNAMQETGDNEPAVFYTDADLQLSEARGGQISLDSARRIREQDLLDESLSDEDLMTVFGSVVTDPKAWLDPELATPGEKDKVLRGMRALRVHGMALVAWCEAAGFTIVFVNGSARRIPAGAIDLVRALCAKRMVTAETVRSACARPEGLDFIAWLLDQGVLDTG